jgi:hypothetical protein
MQVLAIVAPTVPEYLPARQLMQELVVAPKVAEYWPARQSVHVIVPEVVLHLPATQLQHSEPPLLQSQSVWPLVQATKQTVLTIQSVVNPPFALRLEELNSTLATWPGK